jgi:starvation-inducible DNA-binding protein
MEFHKLFEAQYTELEASIDEVAERISKLWKSIGTMKEFADLTIIKESPNHYPTEKRGGKRIIGDHETIIVHLRKDVDTSTDVNKDAGTADF